MGLNFCKIYFSNVEVFTAAERLLSGGSFSSVEHGVASLLTRHTVQQLGLSIPILLLGGDIDDPDVQEVDQSSHHHQSEGESEAGSTFAWPLAFHPGRTVNQSINSDGEINKISNRQFQP